MKKYRIQTTLLKWLASFLLCCWLWSMGNQIAQAQATSGLFKQDTETGRVIPIPATELAELDDPFFNLVLKDRPLETNLAELERLIQPDANQREVFVVHERIVNPSLNQSRRAIMTFQGTNGGETLDSNVMFSVSFNSNSFPDSDRVRQIETWGWDEGKGRYNYYRLDNGPTGSGTPTWKFRGSSVNADTLSSSARQGTCVRCHINGAPIMKELFLPWNNWQSGQAEATYLKPGQTNSWPVATSPRLARLTDAYALEPEIISPIRNFNRKRIAALVQGDRVTDAKRLLKPLFETTEFNIISSRQMSGLHPFSPPTVPSTARIQIPNSFFLNSELIAGGGPAGYQGLGITTGRQFSSDSDLQVTPSEYTQVVRDAGVKLAGRQPGDANFAWFVPEASHIDNDFVDRLMRQGIVPREFVAAALAVDLETPVFSTDRKRLLAVIPNEFSVRPTNDLVEKTIAALEQLNPDENSPEGQFLQNLQNPDPVALLTTKVQDYLAREKNLLRASNTRGSELSRLYARSVQRRQAVLNDPVLRELDETRGTLLFPLP